MLKKNSLGKSLIYSYKGGVGRREQSPQGALWGSESSWAGTVSQEQSFRALYLVQQQEKQRCTAGLPTDSLASIQEQRMLSKAKTCRPSVPERWDLFLSNAALIIQ